MLNVNSFWLVSFLFYPELTMLVIMGVHPWFLLSGGLSVTGGTVKTVPYDMHDSAACNRRDVGDAGHYSFTGWSSG